MYKTALKYGGISALLVVLFLLPGWLLIGQNISYRASQLIGMIGMAIVLIPAALAILKQRQIDGGIISFGKAFGTGMLVTAFAVVAYTAVWLILIEVQPNISVRMWDMYLASFGGEATTEQLEDMVKAKEMYGQFGYRLLATMSEIIPYGLLVSIIGALLLKKK